MKSFPSPQTLSANMLKSGSFKPRVGLFVGTVQVYSEARGATVCSVTLQSACRRLEFRLVQFFEGFFSPSRHKPRQFLII